MIISIDLLRRLNTFHAFAERPVRRTRTYVRNEYGQSIKTTARRNPAPLEEAQMANAGRCQLKEPEGDVGNGPSTLGLN